MIPINLVKACERLKTQHSSTLSTNDPMPSAALRVLRVLGSCKSSSSAWLSRQGTRREGVRACVCTLRVQRVQSDSGALVSSCPGILVRGSDRRPRPQVQDKDLLGPLGCVDVCRCGVARQPGRWAPKLWGWQGGRVTRVRCRRRGMMIQT
jgi:hypothetical protein